jgi:5-methylcytosine-specific restriction protein B
VFIIDEINRGNLSRIFGELLMLIEADKRGPDHAIALTYSGNGERFMVPENVYILGMMNTADRSLAMVDYALRRRFAFVSLEPAFGTQAFRDFLIQAGAEDGLVTLIDDRMSSLNAKIREDTKNLGPGFEVGHSYFVPTEDDELLDETWFRHIVMTQVEPLLREYWFDQTDHAEELLADLEA